MSVLQSIPALWRQRIYISFAVVAVVLGAVQVGYAPDQPHWLAVALNVLGYLGGALGVTAAANVTSVDRPKPAPDNPPHGRHEAGMSRPEVLILTAFLALVVVALVVGLASGGWHVG